MKKQYPYLNYDYSDAVSREDFLTSLDSILNKKGRIKITLLDWEENPIRDIEGEISSGSLSVSGESSVQRTGSITCAISCFDYDASSIQADYSINKKVYIEIGLVNDTNTWKDYPVLWFPQGVFIINSFSLSVESLGAISLNIGLQDKMALLDGTIGGTYPTTVTIDTMDEQANNGKVFSKKIPIYTIIQEQVNHYGNIPMEQIIIEDIGIDTARGEKSKLLLQWNGDEKVYFYKLDGDDSWNIVSETDANSSIYNLTFNEKDKTVIYNKGKSDETKGIYKVYKDGDYIGYEHTNLIYNKELTGSAGGNVADTLNTIANYLGNYQFYFDVYGNFRFREIKNYRYTDPPQIKNLSEDDYLASYLKSGSVHKFSDKTNIISFQQTPQYSNIKNDFYVIGETETDSSTMQIMYHVAIDDKPELNLDGYKNVLIYKEPTGTLVTCGFPELVQGYTAGDATYYYLDNDQTQETIVSNASNGDSYISVEETYTFTEATYKNERISVSSKLAESILPTYGLQNRIYGILDYPTQYSFNNTINDSDTLHIQWVNAIAEYAKDDADGVEPTDIFETSTDNSQIQCGDKVWEILIQKYGEVVASGSDDDGIRPILANELQLKFSTLADASEYASIIDNDIENNAETYKNIRSLGVACSSVEEAKNEYTRINTILTELSLLSTQYQTVYNTFITQGLTVYAEYVQNYINDYIAVKISHYTDLKDYAAAYLTLNNESGYSRHFTRTSTYTVYEPHFYYWNNEWVELTWYRYFDTVPYDYIDFTQELLDSYGSKNASMRLFTPNDDGSVNSTVLKNSDYYSIYIPYAKKNDLSYCDLNVDVIPEYQAYIPKDWRTELLLRGLYNEKIGTDTGDYYAELKAWWGYTYDLLNNCFPWEYEQTKNSDSIDSDDLGRTTSDQIEGYYFLDFIESNSSLLGQYNVNSIGRRTYVDSDESVNCLFTPNAPDFIFYNVSNIAKYYIDDAEVQEKIDSIKEAAGSTPVIQLPDRYYSQIGTGITKNGAYDNILLDINSYTTYQNQISITALPTYYLLPTERVTVENLATNTYGDYMVNSISYTFGDYSNCNISLSQAIDKV